jgi:hypothetical protein
MRVMREKPPDNVHVTGSFSKGDHIIIDPRSETKLAVDGVSNTQTNRL